MFGSYCFLCLGLPFCDPNILRPLCKESLTFIGDSFIMFVGVPVLGIRLFVVPTCMLVRGAFIDACNQAGVQVEVEPRYRKEEDHCAPDGYIYGLRPSKKVAFDLCLAHYGNSVLGSAHIFAQYGLKDAASAKSQNTENSKPK